MQNNDVSQDGKYEEGAAAPPLRGTSSCGLARGALRALQVLQQLH